MYSYEKFNLRIFPWFLLILCIVFAFTELYKEAIISGALGVIFAVSYSGFNIDPEGMRYRLYDKFLWFYIGTWRPIVRPMYVTVVRIRLSNSRNSPLPFPTPGNTKQSLSYKLSIVVDDRTRFIPLVNGKREDMLTEGLRIARLLHVKLLDHTTSEKRWFE